MYWALHVLINIIGFLVSVLIQHHNWQSVIIFPPAVKRQRNGNNKQDQRRRSPTIQIQFEAITSTNATAATHEEGRITIQYPPEICYSKSSHLLFRLWFMWPRLNGIWLCYYQDYYYLSNTKLLIHNNKILTIMKCKRH